MEVPAPSLVVSATRATWLATHGNHRNLVRVLGVHHVATGARLMIEQLPGRDLQALFDAAFPERLGLAEILTIVCDCARGLHFLHELRDAKGTAVRLVHGTLAPALISVGVDGVARVGGLERLCATRGAPRPEPAYAAPEQSIAGAANDRRVDVFALAAILLRTATGLALRDGAMPVPTSQAIPYVPQSVEDVLRKALASEPGKRYDNLEEFRGALEGCIIRDGLRATPEQVARMVTQLLPDIVEPVAPPPLPPRPDQSLWSGAPSAGAPAWMPVESVLDARPATTASGFDVVSVSVPRPILPSHPPPALAPPPTPSVPAAAPAAPTMSLAAFDDRGAAPPPSAPAVAPAPAAVAIEPGWSPPALAMVSPPAPPPRRRLLADPVFLAGGAILLFFAALVIAYLVSG